MPNRSTSHICVVPRANHMEPPISIQTLGVNPFSSTKLNGSLRRFRALIEERTNEKREMTEVMSYVKQQAASAFIGFKRITKENGSIYRSAWERVNSRNRPYSYSQYWTGASLQWRLMRGNVFKCK